MAARPCQLAAALSFIAVIADTAAKSLPPFPWTFNATLSRSYDFGGESRSYHALVPRHGLLVGAIFYFHGATLDAGTMAYLSRDFTAEALRRGYALVYPEGVPDPASSQRCRERTWNGGTCCGQRCLSVQSSPRHLHATFPTYPIGTL